VPPRRHVAVPDPDEVSPIQGPQERGPEIRAQTLRSRQKAGSRARIPPPGTRRNLLGRGTRAHGGSGALHSKGARW
jgi:hypothetical protein